MVTSRPPGHDDFGSFRKGYSRCFQHFSQHNYIFFSRAEVNVFFSVPRRVAELSKHTDGTTSCCYWLINTMHYCSHSSRPTNSETYSWRFQDLLLIFMSIPCQNVQFFITQKIKIFFYLALGLSTCVSITNCWQLCDDPENVLSVHRWPSFHVLLFISRTCWN